MKKVVIVEDDLLLAKHLRRTLERSHYEVHSVAHAIGAIDMIDRVDPDVIFLDMLLTGSTAFVLLHELQSHSDLAKIPVIVCTNLAEDISLEELRPYGVKKVLNKITMEPADIPAALRSVLE